MRLLREPNLVGWACFSVMWASIVLQFFPRSFERLPRRPPPEHCSPVNAGVVDIGTAVGAAFRSRTHNPSPIEPSWCGDGGRWNSARHLHHGARPIAALTSSLRLRITAGPPQSFAAVRVVADCALREGSGERLLSAKCLRLTRTH